MRPSISQVDTTLRSNRALLSRSVAVAVFTAILMFGMSFLSRLVEPNPVETPLISSQGRIFYVASFATAGLVGGAVHVVDPDGTAAKRVTFEDIVSGKSMRVGASGWILPALIAWGACLFLAAYHSWHWLLLVPTLTCCSIVSAILIRYRAVRQNDRSVRRAKLGLFTVTMGAAYLCLSMIYLFKARMLYAGPLVFVAAFLLMVQLVDGLSDHEIRRFAYAATVALVISEAIWGVDYWNVHWAYGGAILASMFYAFSGVSLARLGEECSSRTVYEHVVIAIALFTSIVIFTR